MYKEIICSPLLGAWEFLPKPFPTVAFWEQEWSAIGNLLKKNCWKTDLDLKKTVRNQIKTIVVTNTKQIICFTNRNFEKMTGYSALEVLGKKPSFLQGEATSEISKNIIRNGLEQMKPVFTSVVNYRKCGELYYCNIELYPIFDKKNVLVNYLALEEEGA